MACAASVIATGALVAIGLGAIASSDADATSTHVRDQTGQVTPRLTQHDFYDLDLNMASSPQLMEDFGFEQSERLARRNRYDDIIPNRETSVKLNRSTKDRVHNYINANFIDGNQYIATQGPLRKTIDDFWLMVWEQKVDVIVMVTGIVERGRVKCERYWPVNLDADRITTRDAIHVTMSLTDEHDAERSAPYVRSELLLEHGGETRLVKHFWYDTWPDMDVPDDTNGVSKMLHRIRSESNLGPWVVHCSAGVGRTGTIIGIDMGYRQLMKGDRTSAMDLIKRMRDSRGGMVQTYSQAKFMQIALDGIAESCAAMTK